MPRAYRKKDSPYLVEQVAAKKKILDQLRAVPCTCCGNTYHPCAMDFDHVEPKSFGVMGSYRAKIMDELMVEIKKCEVVCANCHRVRTFLRRQ